MSPRYVPDELRQRAKRVNLVREYKRPLHTVVAIRCARCAAVFRDTLEAEHPCPACGRIARGAA